MHAWYTTSSTYAFLSLHSPSPLALKLLQQHHKYTDTKDTGTHKRTMSEQHAYSMPDDNAPQRGQRQPSADEVFLESVKNGDTDAARRGLEKLRANLSEDKDCQTVVFDAAHEACRGNHDECLALLLPYVDTTQVGFGILLSECVHADHVACTEVLLQHWKYVCSNVAFVREASNQQDVCPAMWEDPAVCQVFIDSGADIEITDEDGRTPLLKASSYGELAVVKMLVKAGAGVRVTDEDGDNCLTLAAYFGYVEIVRYLVAFPEVDVNHAEEEGYTALHFAGQENQPAVVEVLIDAGADVEAIEDDRGRTPLLLASLSGALDCVKLLVRAGAGVCVTDNEGDTCLILAAYFGRIETVRYLLCMPEVDVDHSSTEGFTALHVSGQKLFPEVVQVLIDAGADVDVKGDMGRTALHNACENGELADVKMLVRAGAGVSVTDNEGDTCLILAACAGCTRTVRYLVGLPEVDVNHQGSNNLTALQRAADESHPNVMRVLIDAGADLESIDDDMPPSPGSVSGD